MMYPVSSFPLWSAEIGKGFFSLFGLICVHSPLPDELCEWDKKSLRAFGESWSRWVRHFSPHFFLVFVPRIREKRWVEEESFGAGPPPAPLLDEEKSGEIFGIPFLVAQSTVNPYFFFFPLSLSLIWAYLSPSLPTLAVKTSSNSFLLLSRLRHTHTRASKKRTPVQNDHG